ncbi:MAG: cupin domain-containing protein [Mycobacteriales bacterium]
MVPDDSAANSQDRHQTVLYTSASDAALGANEGIELWRGFDSAALRTQAFLARARVESGISIPAHWHSQDTIAYLVEGRALFRSGADLEHVHEMAPGDWLFVPAGMVHVEETPDGAVADFLYARDGGGGTTTYVEDEGKL